MSTTSSFDIGDSLATEMAASEDVCGVFCETTPSVTFTDEWGVEVHWCRECYKQACGRCREPFEKDANKRKGLCQDCRERICSQSRSSPRGSERDVDSAQTTLMTDGGTPLGERISAVHPLEKLQRTAEIVEQKRRQDRVHCPDCGTTVWKDSIEEAVRVAERHNEKQHGGVTVTRVNGMVLPDFSEEEQRVIREAVGTIGDRTEAEA